MLLLSERQFCYPVMLLSEFVRMEGLEPSRLSARHPKCRMSAYSTTSAFAAHITHRGSVVLVKQLKL